MWGTWHKFFLFIWHPQHHPEDMCEETFNLTTEKIRWGGSEGKCLGLQKPIFSHLNFTKFTKQTKENSSLFCMKWFCLCRNTNCSLAQVFPSLQNFSVAMKAKWMNLLWSNKKLESSKHEIYVFQAGKKAALFWVFFVLFLFFLFVFIYFYF